MATMGPVSARTRLIGGLVQNQQQKPRTGVSDPHWQRQRRRTGVSDPHGCVWPPESSFGPTEPLEVTAVRAHVLWGVAPGADHSGCFRALLCGTLFFRFFFS